MGRARPIIRRLCRVTVVLGRIGREEEPKEKAPAQA
jgi:hypothetical protein